MKQINHRLSILLCVLLLALAGCSDGSFRTIRTVIDYSSIKKEPLSRTGNKPYVVYGVRYIPLPSAVGYREKGIASWYGKKFHGRRTSSGETYDMYAMTAAHKTLPLPTYVAVTNLRNDKKIIVKVNDRGPFIRGRLIDLSYAAAQELDLVRAGTGPVLIEALTPWSSSSTHTELESLDFFVSAGVFSNRNNAYKLTVRLKNSGFETAHIRTKGESDSKLHQVLIGPFSSAGEAQKRIQDISSYLTESPVIVSE